MFSLLLMQLSESPDLSIQNTKKNYEKGHTTKFFSEKMTFGNSEFASFLEAQRNLNKMVSALLSQQPFVAPSPVKNAIASRQTYPRAR